MLNFQKICQVSLLTEPDSWMCVYTAINCKEVSLYV